MNFESYVVCILSGGSFCDCDITLRSAKNSAAKNTDHVNLGCILYMSMLKTGIKFTQNKGCVLYTRRYGTCGLPHASAALDYRSNLRLCPLANNPDQSSVGVRDRWR